MSAEFSENETALSTPVKVYNHPHCSVLQCAVCLSSASRLFSLQGRKCVNENVSDMLVWLVGETEYHKLITYNAKSTICKNCLNRLQKAHEFKCDALASIGTYVQGKAIRTKREASSPSKTTAVLPQLTTVATPSRPPKKVTNNEILSASSSNIIITTDIIFSNLSS